MGTLFISDLHLDRGHPEISRQFLDFLRSRARGADALYILGDLFEVWIGDDDPEEHKRSILGALRELTASGVPCYVMMGNRDFLFGRRFQNETGCELLHDPVVADLYGQRVLLTHGDALCTDDAKYQQLRAMVRDAGWQKLFLDLPVEHRRALADSARAGSKNHMQQAAPGIMDVNQETVAAVMRAAKVRLLVHGHTHRPAVHDFMLDGQEATRIVLGDWYEQGSLLEWTENGFELLQLQRG